ncbi:hypothetical protein, partial [Endozoicomonas sp. ONNA2]|uniref:hypothetical protein n=1 Tax=Endozoicomonas sp. ONNA2 TaxID=2828741 RepID=UPI0021487E05
MDSTRPVDFSRAIRPDNVDEVMRQNLPAGFPGHCTEFSGHSVGVGAGASNIPSPPPYSFHDPQGSGLSCPPPVYTPTANTPGLVSGSDAPATLENCLLEMEAAYQTNFTKLADTLSNAELTSRGKRPLWFIFHTFLDEKALDSSSQELRLPGKKMLDFYQAEHGYLTNCLAHLNYASKLSQLTLVLCMHFLEQKFILEQESIPQYDVDFPMSENDQADCQDLQAALVRKTFFTMLQTGIKKTGLGYYEQKIDKFIEKNSGLKKDMRLEHPVNVNLKFSGLRYEDIPGATVAKILRPRIEAYRERYNIDVEGLIEALGQTNTRHNRNPLEQIMKETFLKTGLQKHKPNNFFNNPYESYRDRNARTVLELMELRQKESLNKSGKYPERESMVKTLERLI